MRVPKIRDLTPAQRDVYLYAPADAHVLVKGPPGTGKTLIAWLRADTLWKDGYPVSLCMFNHVLMKYASSVDDAHASQISVTTAKQWFRDWWLRAGLPPSPHGGDVLVNAPREDKEAVKAAGAHWRRHVWNPWTGLRGVWAVEYEEWEAKSSGLTAWSCMQVPPEHPDSKDDYDWDAIRDCLLDHVEALDDNALSLGTLLIDEGQDFPPSFYRFLGVMSAFGAGKRVKFPLRCFVLADENQQLTKFNSTLENIRKSLKILEVNEFPLLDNFRNTREIAELAAGFHADVGAVPLLPERRGEIPLFVTCDGLPQCVKRIVTWAANHPGKEAGVLVFRESKRQELHERLARGATSIKGRTVTVQSYSWDSRRENPADKLVFDTGDVITVLNMQSCKGLEFDAVFIVDPHDSAIASLGTDRFRMQMFVGVSRGREWVEILESAPAAEDAPFLKELPTERYLVRVQPAREVPASRPLYKVTPAEPRPVPSVEDWPAAAVALARKNGFVHEDLRPKGCFWVYAPESFAMPMEKLGFRFTAGRGGWWRKQ